MNKIISFLKNNWIIITILLVALFLRAYKPLEYYLYNHDQDLTGWIIKDILVNHHIRLIGQQTSSLGIFIGPIFYYLQIPFYLLTKMDPFGVLLLPFLLGMFAVFSFYFVLGNIFNKKVGIIAALIYAISTIIVFTDREAVPTMPVVLWAVWYFYSLWKITKGEQKYYLLIGILFGLVWNLSLSLAVISPLVILAYFFSKQKIDVKYLALGIGLFIILMSPFFIFEGRHNFIQTGSLVASFTTQKDYIPGTGKGLAKLDRVMQIVHKNTTKIYWNNTSDISPSTTFYILTLMYLVLVLTKTLKKDLAIMILLWQILFILFFTFNSINISEYYLNGMNLVWIAILSLFVNKLLENKNTKYLGYLILCIFVYVNIIGFFNTPVNRSGYIERKQIIDYIYNDAKAHEYPCVAVSYITSPGNNMGYRYLFYLKGMHINLPKSGSPVYTIVFPLSMVNGFDKSFGALGVILPDYKMYNSKTVEISCSGENSNLTEPMFGYTD